MRCAAACHAQCALVAVRVLATLAPAMHYAAAFRAQCALVTPWLLMNILIQNSTFFFFFFYFFFFFFSFFFFFFGSSNQQESPENLLSLSLSQVLSF